MAGFVDPRTGAIKLARLLMLNSAAVLLLVGIVTCGAIDPYPWAIVWYMGLFVLNFVLLWPGLRRTKSVQGAPGPKSRPGWIAAAVFTPLSIAAVDMWARNPNGATAGQAIFAVMLVGYIWYLLYRLCRRKDN